LAEDHDERRGDEQRVGCGERADDGV